VQFGTWFGGVRNRERDAGGPTGYKTEDAPVKVRIAVDGDYAKVYVNEKRVSNVPNAKLGRGKKVYLALNGWSEESPRMIADVRIAAGGRPMYDALTAAGRVATQGIYFDTGSDRVRPESGPTLKEIAAMLAAHADLRLAIEGHTDAAGDAAANKALSQRPRRRGEGGARRRLRRRRRPPHRHGDRRRQAGRAQHHRRGAAGEPARGAGEALAAANGRGAGSHAVGAGPSARPGGRAAGQNFTISSYARRNVSTCGRIASSRFGA
jgi:outer membrane protein OmpA-like peptidoglycan-associated protein